MNMTEKEQMLVLRRGLDKIRDIGIVYDYPDDWNIWKAGGAPSISDYDQIDLGDMVDEILREANL